MEQRRHPRLCFPCGEKYSLSHQCKRQLLLLEGEEEEMEAGEEVTAFQSEFEAKDNGEVFLHALKGLTNSKIIKVEGRIPDCKLMVLIDSGSTYNFLDKSSKESGL